jgi:hypothetical protein
MLSATLAHAPIQDREQACPSLVLKSIALAPNEVFRAMDRSHGHGRRHTHAGIHVHTGLDVKRRFKIWPGRFRATPPNTADATDDRFRWVLVRMGVANSKRLCPGKTKASRAGAHRRFRCPGSARKRIGSGRSAGTGREKDETTKRAEGERSLCLPVPVAGSQVPAMHSATTSEGMARLPDFLLCPLCAWSCDVSLMFVFPYEGVRVHPTPTWWHTNCAEHRPARARAATGSQVYKWAQWSRQVNLFVTSGNWFITPGTSSIFDTNIRQLDARFDHFKL